MGRIIQPIGDKIIIPKRKIKKPRVGYWMGIEDTPLMPRFPGAMKVPKGIMTPNFGGPSGGDRGETAAAAEPNQFYITAGLVATDSADSPPAGDNIFLITAGLPANDRS